MVYDAIIAKIFDDDEDKIFLFFSDPKTEIIRDGLDLLDSLNIYMKLPYDTLVVVEVLLKDGTKEVNIDIGDFITGKYGKYDIFIHIKDIMPFKLGRKDDETGDMMPRTVVNVIKDGEFQQIASECILMSKKEIENKQKDE